MSETSVGMDPHVVTKRYLDTLGELLQGLDHDAIADAVGLLRTARDRHRTVYLAGNGGSAASASHLANDLGKATRRSGRALMRVMCLSDNTPWFSALANDEGYDRVFAGQLENFAVADDVLLVISASGNSPNLLRAVELAHERGVATIGLLGFDGGALLSMVDVALHVASAHGLYGPVESAHSVVADILTTCLIEDIEPGTVVT